MKNHLFLSLFILLIPLSCRDDSTNTLDDTDVTTQELTGKWVLFAFIDKTTGSAESMSGFDGGFIEFKGESTIFVQTCCNSGDGTVKIEDRHVTITELAMTEKACPDVGTCELRFTNNLSGNYQFKNDQLTIISDHDTDLSLIRSE